jgi:hypothetical protein
MRRVSKKDSAALAVVGYLAIRLVAWPLGWCVALLILFVSGTVAGVWALRQEPRWRRRAR